MRKQRQHIGMRYGGDVRNSLNHADNELIQRSLRIMVNHAEQTRLQLR